MGKISTNGKKKILLYATLIVIVQSFLMLCVFLIPVNFLSEGIHSCRMLILFCNVYVASSILTLLGIGAVICLKKFLAEEEMKIKTSQMQLEQSRDLIQSLRIQHHDFKNHLNVIKVWAELNDTKSILRYLKEEQITIIDPLAFDEIRCPVLQGIFLVTQAKAATENIKFTVESALSLEDFNFSWDKINQIFSNILNNALEAVKAQERKRGVEPEIVLYIMDSEDRFIFQIWTPTILPEKTNPSSLFECGFSTKEEAGHGFGLYIAKKLISELKGTIEVHSHPEKGTEFQIELPKREKGFSPQIQT
ncbi:MAG TPA: GHKL domain-containing protein [Firmicutes bacterium]|nr:GHKL domain-containing protein [Bacillota bacterium]